MSFFQDLFAFKFKWLKALFNNMQHAWNHLAQDEQAISLKASGIIAIINANLDKTPEIVFTLIQERFPDVTPAFLHSILDKGSSYLKIADGVASLSLEDAIKAYQAHLGSVTGNGWIALTQQAVGALLTVMLPETTTLNKITVILEFIYDHFIKGKIA